MIKPAQPRNAIALSSIPFAVFMSFLILAASCDNEAPATDPTDLADDEEDSRRSREDLEKKRKKQDALARIRAEGIKQIEEKEAKIKIAKKQAQDCIDSSEYVRITAEIVAHNSAIECTKFSEEGDQWCWDSVSLLITKGRLKGRRFQLHFTSGYLKAKGKFWTKTGSKLRMELKECYLSSSYMQLDYNLFHDRVVRKVKEAK